MTSDTPKTDIHDDQSIALVGCGKYKKNPYGDDTADESNEFQAQLTDVTTAPKRPTWKAREIYTSTYFGAKRDYADYITEWIDGPTEYRWSVLSAKHHVIPHTEHISRYNRSIDNIDRENIEYYDPDTTLQTLVGNTVTSDFDIWVRNVAETLQQWLSTLMEGLNQSTNDKATPQVVIMAGQTYTQPLKDYVFEYGLTNLSSLKANYETDWLKSVEPIYLFDEIPAGGNGEQIEWLKKHTPEQHQ
jgi:hypothetical protein